MNKFPLDPIINTSVFIELNERLARPNQRPFPSAVTLYPRNCGKSLLGIDWGSKDMTATAMVSIDPDSIKPLDPTEHTEQLRQIQYYQEIVMRHTGVYPAMQAYLDAAVYGMGGYTVPMVIRERSPQEKDESAARPLSSLPDIDAPDAWI